MSTSDAEYVEVSIDEFGLGREIPFDIFIKLSATHYVRLAGKGDDLTQGQLEKFRDHKIKALYLRKEDFLKYAGLKLRQEAPKDEAAARQLNEMCRMGDITLEIVFFNEMNEIVFGTARNFVETTVSLLTDSRHAAGLLSPLNGSTNFIYAHGVAVSAYSVMIARALGWTNTANIFRLATGALLHDIGKRSIHRDILLKPTDKLKPSEVDKLKEHPVLGVRIMEQVQSVPTDIIEIILQHHENALGTGYPNKLSRVRIHPMARIVGTANGFCNLVLRGADGPGLKPVEALKEMSATGEYDPESFAALATLFKQ